jgi:hypothetical protein
MVAFLSSFSFIFVALCGVTICPWLHNYLTKKLRKGIAYSHAYAVAYSEVEAAEFAQQTCPEICAWNFAY